ncbi:MAG: glucose 1-dehydrogenase [Gemmatimonadetes bacterium]|nr:glucose 1-dehydrogenase [Gemmatimonadota bacterium]MCC6773892.1 glucose 1-dehydrogenase [Gemmatimonadaceae bacterium]
MTDLQVSLAGKVALVTGGARDIGAATVRSLAANGAAVVINYHSSASQATALAAEIVAAGGRALAVQADVADERQVAAMVDATRAAFGDRIDILVNNAGGLVARKSMEQMDTAFWRQVLDLNLTSVFTVTKAVLPLMGEGGTIVNLASLAARDGGGGGALAYSAAKGAVMTLTRGLSKELAPRRIRVNCVSPGMINTTFHDTFTKPEIRQAVAGRTSVGREGSSQDVANAVLFLASSASAYVNGESLEINGGLYFV